MERRRCSRASQHEHLYLVEVSTCTGAAVTEGGVLTPYDAMPDVHADFHAVVRRRAPPPGPVDFSYRSGDNGMLLVSSCSGTVRRQANADTD